MRLQTLRNAAVGTHARSSDPALILLADVDTSFDFQFNDYLHPASLCAAPHHCATARSPHPPDLFHFPIGKFLTCSVFIVSSVSGNSLRGNTNQNIKIAYGWNRDLIQPKPWATFSFHERLHRFHRKAVLFADEQHRWPGVFRKCKRRLQPLLTLATYRAHLSPLTSHPPLTSHLSPLTSHLSPLTSHLSPLTSHLSPLTSHLSPLTSHLSPLTSHLSPLTSHLSPLTSHLSPLTSHLSPLTPHLSPLTSHLSPLTSHLSPLTSHLSPLTSHLSPPPPPPLRCRCTNKYAKITPCVF